MGLLLSNRQGELPPLEVGTHALRYVQRAPGGRGKRGGLSEYAERIGRSKSAVSMLRDAAEVLQRVGLSQHVGLGALAAGRMARGQGRSRSSTGCRTCPPTPPPPGVELAKLRWRIEHDYRELKLAGSVLDG